MSNEHIPIYYPTAEGRNKRRVYLTKEFTFEAAHRLCQHNGLCSQLHGHTYRLLITVSGCVSNPPDTSTRDLKSLMVTDFSTLKDIVQENIVKQHDHTYLNDLYGDNPTAEVMCVSMFDTLDRIFPPNKRICVEKVTLYETPTSYAEYRREEKCPH